MISVNTENCIGCGDCATVCPQQCFEFDEGGRSRYVHSDRCMDCGACQLNCLGGAISVDAGAGCYVNILKESVFGKRVASVPGSSLLCCGPTGKEETTTCTPTAAESEEKPARTKEEIKL